MPVRQTINIVKPVDVTITSISVTLSDPVLNDVVTYFGSDPELSIAAEFESLFIDSDFGTIDNVEGELNVAFQYLGTSCSRTVPFQPEFNGTVWSIQTSMNGTFNPSIVGGGVKWGFADGTVVSGSSPNKTLDGSTQQVDIYIDDLSTITQLSFANQSLVGAIVFPVFTNVFNYAFNGNIGITALDFSNCSGTTTNFNIGGTGITGVQDLTMFNISNYFSCSNCAILGNILFATNSTPLSFFYADSTGIQTLNVSMLDTRGTFYVRNSSTTQTIVFNPSPVGAFSDFRLEALSSLTTLTNISSQDLRGTVRIRANPLMGNITLNNNGACTFLFLPENNSVTSWDLTGMTLTQQFYCYSSSALTTLNFANGTVLGGFYFYNCPSLTDLGVDNVALSGTFKGENCTSLTNITHMDSVGTFLTYDCDGCRINTINFDVFTTDKFERESSLLNLRRNLMSTSEINKILVDLDSITVNSANTGMRMWFDAGTRFVSGNEEPDASSGGNDGLAAVTSLQGKNREVLIPNWV